MRPFSGKKDDLFLQKSLSKSAYFVIPLKFCLQNIHTFWGGHFQNLVSASKIGSEHGANNFARSFRDTPNCLAVVSLPKPPSGRNER